MDTYLDEKKVNIWQYLASMSHIGVKSDPHIIIFTAQRLQQYITIVGLNMMWKLLENLEHDIVFAYLGISVFVPTEKALGMYKMKI